MVEPMVEGASSTHEMRAKAPTVCGRSAEGASGRLVVEGVLRLVRNETQEAAQVKTKLGVSSR
jgi:hypothetical protein